MHIRKVYLIFTEVVNSNSLQTPKCTRVRNEPNYFKPSAASVMKEVRHSSRGGTLPTAARTSIQEHGSWPCPGLISFKRQTKVHAMYTSSPPPHRKNLHRQYSSSRLSGTITITAVFSFGLHNGRLFYLQRVQTASSRSHKPQGTENAAAAVNSPADALPRGRHINAAYTT